MCNSTLAATLLFTRRRAKQKLKAKANKTRRSITRDVKFILLQRISSPALAATKPYVTNRLSDVTKRTKSNDECEMMNDE
jgi:hypothetical protein